MWCTEQFEVHFTGKSAVQLSKCAENILSDQQWFHPHFVHIFTFNFVFKGEVQKKYDAQKIGEEKTRAFHQGQAETSWQICTSSEVDQMHFPEASHKDTLPSWRCGQAPLMRGDPRRSCSKSVHSGGCGSYKPTAFQDLGQHKCFVGNCLLCTPALSPSLLSSGKAEDPGLGLLSQDWDKNKRHKCICG